MNSADHYIKELGLESHIEGGYFKEIYRNPNTIDDGVFTGSFEGRRALSTTIYFLLKSGQVSKFHRLKFDEIWFYHAGCSMAVYTIDSKGELVTFHLGIDLKNGETPQLLVPANTIFGAEPLKEESFSFVSCMVSPGFDFRDFMLFNHEELINLYPQHRDIIHKLNG